MAVHQKYKEFMNFVNSLPPAPKWAVDLTVEELRNMMVDDMLEQWEHFEWENRV